MTDSEFFDKIIALGPGVVLSTGRAYSRNTLCIMKWKNKQITNSIRTTKINDNVRLYWVQKKEANGSKTRRTTFKSFKYYRETAFLDVWQEKEEKKRRQGIEAHNRYKSGISMVGEANTPKEIEKRKEQRRVRRLVLRFRSFHNLQHLSYDEVLDIYNKSKAEQEARRIEALEARNRKKKGEEERQQRKEEERKRRQKEQEKRRKQKARLKEEKQRLKQLEKEKQKAQREEEKREREKKRKEEEQRTKQIKKEQKQKDSLLKTIKKEAENKQRKIHEKNRAIRTASKKRNKTQEIKLTEIIRNNDPDNKWIKISIPRLKMQAIIRESQMPRYIEMYNLKDKEYKVEQWQQ